MTLNDVKYLRNLRSNRQNRVVAYYSEMGCSNKSKGRSAEPGVVDR
jgi:hypothetical protein